MQQGSEVAFTALYNHYGPRLYLNILRMVKDDSQTGELVQELFTRIWQKRTSKGISDNFEGYVYRVAQNLVYDFFRKLKRDHQLLAKFRALAEENYEYIEEGLQQKENFHFLHKAIEQLPPQQRPHLLGRLLVQLDALVPRDPGGGALLHRRADFREPGAEVHGGTARGAKEQKSRPDDRS